MKVRVVAGFLMALCSSGTISSCSEPRDIGDTEPAAGKELEQISQNITRNGTPSEHASLVQRFCMNTTRQPCNADIQDKLAVAGFKQGSGVDLATAFIAIVTEKRDPVTELSDTEFLNATYKVILGRMPDEGGAEDHIRFLKETGQRGTLLRAFLQSQEFKHLP